MKKNVDMTEGVIWKQLLLFSIPLSLGDLLQQLYNTVDSVIVGRFAGKNRTGRIKNDRRGGHFFWRERTIAESSARRRALRSVSPSQSR